MRRAAWPAALALVVLAVPVRGQDAGAHLAAMRSRWSAMSPAEQELVRQRFAELQRMSPAAREELTRRTGALAAEREGVRHDLGERERVALEALPHHLRRRVLNERLREERVARASELRAELPAELLRELERAAPSERPQIIERAQRARRDRASRQLVARLARTLDLPAADRERLQALPADERAPRALGLLRELALARAAARGLPAGVSAEVWASWGALSDERFLEELMRHVGPGLLGGGQRRELDPDPRARLAGDAGERERLELLARLEGLTRPRFDDLIELSRMSDPERRRAVHARVRERCLEFLRAHALASEAELAELARLEGRELVDAVRERCRREVRTLRRTVWAQGGGAPAGEPRARWR